MEFLKACATYRLAKDLREVLRNPVNDVCAQPVDNDLFVWHGNVRSDHECLGGAPVHFMLIFPSDYPLKPPECRLFQPIPHPNVRAANSVSVHGKPVPREARWRLAIWDCVQDVSTWSSAYSVSSILVQLQVFLLIEDMPDFAAGQAMDAVTRSVQELSCPACFHKPAAPHPAFLTADEIESVAAAARMSKTVVSKPQIPTRSQETALQLWQHQHSSMPQPVKLVQKPSPVPAANGKAPTSTSNCNGTSKPTPAGADSTTPAPSEDEWKVVSGKKAVRKSVVSHVQGAKAGTSAVGPVQSSSSTSSMGGNTFNALLLESAMPQVMQAVAAVTTSKDSVTTTAASDAAPAKQLPSAVPLNTKTAKKNLARKLKKLQTKSGTPAEETKGAPVASSTSKSAVVPAPVKPADNGSHTVGVSSASGSNGAVDGFVSVKQKGKGKTTAEQNVTTPDAVVENTSVMPLTEQVKVIMTRKQADIIQETLNSWKQEQQAYNNSLQPTVNRFSMQQLNDLPVQHDSQHTATLLGLQQPMGLFSLLSRDDLLAVLCLLKPSELDVLSLTCKGMRAACQDGALWQSLIKAHFPGTNLAASRMSDWKHAYMVEANSILADLKCFYTRATFEEEVLGLPLTYTINPKTKKVDYIEAYPELMAVSAFEAGVDKTSRQESIKAVLPLYLTADHFTRAQRHYGKLLRQLAPDEIGPGGTAPPATAWLDVLSKLLNTSVVLLCDHGQAASHKALSVYYAVHRLLLAMCQAHNIWATVRKRLDAFISSAKNRTKETCPNLGLLLPLLSLSRTHTWQMLAQPLLSEMFARNVLWVCKSDPSLEARYRAGRKPGEADTVLLDGSWKGALVSKRLLMFHLAFFHIVGAPKGCSLETVMDNADATYSQANVALCNRFMKAVKRILEVDSWKQYMAILGMPPVSDEYLTNLLKDAWTRSCKQGYTKSGMDYSRVHASGVSKILLKGETYTAPPGMKAIELKDCWSWKGMGIHYLDASILLYGPSREYLEAIDYSHMWSFTTAKQGAVRHSGDIIEMDAGTHIVNIDLQGLGPQVVEMYVVASSFAGAMLDVIVNPYIRVCDPATDMDLCQYNLENQSRDVLARHSSVIMARVYRTVDSQGKPTNDWKVQALGVLGSGYANNYEPILSTIATATWST